MAKNRKKAAPRSSLPERVSGQRAGNPKMLVNQIVVRPIARRSSDIDAWRNALQSADMGRIKALYDLFEDLLIDGVLSDALDKRISAVTNSELTFQDADGKEVLEVSDLMDSPAWEDLLTAIMQVRFWGRAGIEFDFTNGFEAHAIPPKHIKIDNTQILINEYDDSGVSYLGDDHILVLGKKRDFGLLMKTAPFAIYKRGGYGDYAQWLELFGMPQRIGKYSSYDLESRRLLEEAMERQGSAHYIVAPKETDIEVIESKGVSGGKSPYNEFRNACNEEMLITILGQTMTTVQGDKGARSLGEVHKQVEEGKNKADMRFVQRVLNYYVLPVLEKRGLPVTGGKFIFPKAAQEITVDEIVKLSGVMDIPVSFLHEKYSIPVAVDGEPVAGSSKPSAPGDAPEAAKPGEQDPPDDDQDPEPKKPGKKAKKIKNADRGFWKGLYNLFSSEPRNSRGIRWRSPHAE
jgi:phage gp29-like protein